MGNSHLLRTGWKIEGPFITVFGSPGPLEHQKFVKVFYSVIQQDIDSKKSSQVRYVLISASMASALWDAQVVLDTDLFKKSRIVRWNEIDPKSILSHTCLFFEKVVCTIKGESFDISIIVLPDVISLENAKYFVQTLDKGFNEI